MKKIYYFIIFIITLINFSACTGYKPIFISSNLEFEISDHSISGDKKLGNQIYTKLYNLSKSNKKKLDTKKFYILINASRNKNATAKDGAGKILGYRITTNITIVVKNIKTSDEILNKNFNYSSTYAVQKRFSETIKLENKIIDDLINKTYQDLIIKLSENIL